MIPRKRLDISWSDLLFAFSRCLLPHSSQPQKNIECFWGTETQTFVCLSIRTGFDLLLQSLQLPEGSEVLMSALTIRDMVRIVEAHKLIPIPLDIDPETLSVRPETLAKALSPKSRMIVLAHLFGSQMSLDPLIPLARKAQLFIVEDAAQAYSGPEFKGHPKVDLSMFSFGTIKTSTAFGGAIFHFREASLCQTLKEKYRNYPLQTRSSFGKRLFKYSLLKALSFPLCFTLFYWFCQRTHRSYDQILNQSIRGFADASHFFEAIRLSPSFPLLALLERRLQHFNSRSLDQRKQTAHAFIEKLSSPCYPGVLAESHSFWVFPYYSDRPLELMEVLRNKGFDATRGSSSMETIPPSPMRPEIQPLFTTQLLQKLLYLPIYPQVSLRHLEKLSQALKDFEKLYPLQAIPSASSSSMDTKKGSLSSISF
jgi:perosamine synthetase